MERLDTMYKRWLQMHESVSLRSLNLSADHALALAMQEMIVQMEVIKDFEMRIATLEKNMLRWRAPYGGYFWTIEYDGNVVGQIENQSDQHDALWKIGNYYRTKEDAHIVADKTKPVLNGE